MAAVAVAAAVAGAAAADFIFDGKLLPRVRKNSFLVRKKILDEPLVDKKIFGKFSFNEALQLA